jgi:hypothetical protein
MTTGARVEAHRAPEPDQATARDRSRWLIALRRWWLVADRRRWFVAVREALFIVVATQLYSRVRGIADSQINVAYDNAERIIAFERAVNVFAERSVQQAVIGTEAIIHVANTIYIWGFAPLMVSTLAWLIIRRPAHYALFRNALLSSGAVALVLFATFPLAPPRFMPHHGFVDTVELHASWYRTFNGSAVVNEFAAMPSLHFGWVLLASIAIASLTRIRAIRIAAITAPLLMLAAIVITANHYFVDGVVGAAVVACGLAGAYGMRRRFGTGRPGGLW